MTFNEWKESLNHVELKHGSFAEASLEFDDTTENTILGDEEGIKNV